MMTTMMKKSHSTISQDQLHALSLKAVEHIDDLFICLGISNLKLVHNKYTGPCPIHGGDKFNAFNLYNEGESYSGNWKCRTQQCEKMFKASIIGFVRGVLSHNKYGWTGPGDKVASFSETIDFITSCLKQDINSLEIDLPELEKNQFVRQIDALNKKRKLIKDLPRDKFRQTIQIPANYFINRGYTKEILDTYDVGLCIDPRNMLYNRVVVPIYDDEYQYTIGTTSRSIFEICKICKTWHNPKYECPRPEEMYKCCKWRHSYGFKKEDHLYNYWRSRYNISKSKVAILTESPGNVWRLEETGINNSIATFGASFSCMQKQLLDHSGCLTLILAMDNDDAGKRCEEEIKKMCGNSYTIHTFSSAPKNDIGEFTIDELKNSELFLLNEKCIKNWERL